MASARPPGDRSKSPKRKSEEYKFDEEGREILDGPEGKFCNHGKTRPTVDEHDNQKPTSTKEDARIGRQLSVGPWIAKDDGENQAQVKNTGCRRPSITAGRTCTKQWGVGGGEASRDAPKALRMTGNLPTDADGTEWQRESPRPTAPCP